MSSPVFRKEALERLSSPEQLDQLMPVTNSRGWVSLAGVGLLLLMGLAWGLFGEIETTVEGSGLLMRHGGFELVDAPFDGRVVELLVEADSKVNQGDVVLRMARLVDGKDVIEPVISPLTGRVLDVAVLPGSAVVAGEMLLSVEDPKTRVLAVVYIPASDGFKVHSHMPAKVVPATANKHGSSQLAGTVQSAGRFPATRAEMMYSLQNEEWARDLVRQGPALQVIIELTGKASRLDLYSGTPCQAVVTVEQRRPIDFLLPNPALFRVNSDQ